jgi:excisionase family DNA binding protein
MQADAQSDAPLDRVDAEQIDLGDVLSALERIERLLAEQSSAALGRDAAARYLGVSVATLDRLTSAGKLKSVRVSVGRVVWRRIDLEKYLGDLAE